MSENSRAIHILLGVLSVRDRAGHSEEKDSLSPDGVNQFRFEMDYNLTLNWFDSTRTHTPVWATR